MASVIVFHEIDDSAHWLASPKREELFAPMGITMRTLLDPTDPNRAAVQAEVPNLDALNALMQSEAVAAAMGFDGVRADTVVVTLEA